VLESGQVFSNAFEIYLQKGAVDEVESSLEEIQNIEHAADNLRRNIELELYTRTLIPDLRSDVLRLLENIDSLTNMYKANLFRLSIQQPDISTQFCEEFRKLSQTAVQCVDTLIITARSFFRDLDAVRNNVRKVVALETDADRISSPLQRNIFASELSLDQKMHLRYFVERIDELANQAEDVADQLAISAIKRRI
jgi:predicted phosphate transport protein (TIGR00153 family)